MQRTDIIRIAREELARIRTLELDLDELSRLHAARFELSNRMTTTAGLAYTAGPRRGLIKLSTSIFTDPRNAQHVEEHLRNTIRHEIAHIACPNQEGHGAEWKRVAKLMGCTAERCHNMAVKFRKEYTWSIDCPDCGKHVGKIYNRVTVTRWVNSRTTRCCRVRPTSKKV